MLHCEPELVQDPFLKRGWIITQADSLQPLLRMREGFIDRMTESGLYCKDIDDLREELSTLEMTKINELRSLAFTDFSRLVADAFGSLIKNSCGDHIFIQRRPHISFNIGQMMGTVTPPHTELLSGHSPYTYVLWAPLHDVDDEAGLFCMNVEPSLEFMEEQGDFETPYDEEETRQVSPAPLKLKFGEAILFNSFVLHGAWPHTSRHARIALHFRIQSCEKPLFEKNIEFFTHHQLTKAGNIH